MQQEIYEQYPWRVVVLASVLQLLNCLAGLYIMFKLNLITGVLFIVFILFLELSVYKQGCVHCCYFGKRCAFGRGIIVSKIFKKGDAQKFCSKPVNFKSFIPHVLFSAIPVVVGIALLIFQGLSVILLIAVVYPVLVWVVVSPTLYGKIVCPHCRQGSICCPVLKFFDRNKKKKNGNKEMGKD